MKKLFFPLAIVALALGTAFSTFGQTDRNKVEGFAGYSWLSTDTGEDIGERVNAHGFNGAITGNVSRYLGITGDFSLNSKKGTFADGTDNFSGRFRTTQFLGGIQIKDNAKDGKTVKPFARALAGVANQNINVNGTFGGSPFNETFTANNFALALGGGIDVKVSDRVDIRVIQAEYNPIFFRDQMVGGTTFQGGRQNNFRLSFGVVIH